MSKSPIPIRPSNPLGGVGSPDFCQRFSRKKELLGDGGFFCTLAMMYKFSCLYKKSPGPCGVFLMESCCSLKYIERFGGSEGAKSSG